LKVSEMHNDAGLYTGFSVSNLLLSRRRACRIAANVPGARVLRTPRLFGPDDFCAFEVDGVPFLIIEPFGDNDQFWVVAEEPSDSAHVLIDRVRETFIKSSCGL
jgi:hypothetical protein